MPNVSGKRARKVGPAGIEGTMSQGVRAIGLRECCYIGKAKTHPHQVLTVTVNVVRVSEWIDGTPVAKRRRSAFSGLMASAA